MKVFFAFFFIQILHSSVYVIGDSHVREFDGIPGCVLKHLGPILMHRVGRDSLQAINLKNLGVEEGAWVVYVCGEIDVRCHLLEQRDLKNRASGEIIDTLTSNFIQTVLKNQSQYQNLKSIVYNIVPPLNGSGYNPEYPVYGTIEDRVKITKELNERLKMLCDQNGIRFLDVYDAYAYEDGSLCFEYSDGNVHIDSKYNIPIQQRLYELISFKFP